MERAQFAIRHIERERARVMGRLTSAVNHQRAAGKPSRARDETPIIYTSARDPLGAVLAYVAPTLAAYTGCTIHIYVYIIVSSTLYYVFRIISEIKNQFSFLFFKNIKNKK